MVAAPAYDTSPAVPCIAMPLPLFVALCRRQGQQRAQLEASRQREAATRAFWRRPDIEPADKVIGTLTAWELGFAPGSPNPERPREWRKVCRDRIRDQSGINLERIGAAWKAQAQAGWFRRREIRSRAEGHARTVIAMAAPEGLDWPATWGSPETMPAPEKPERLARDATRQKAKAERVRAILAQCPQCGSLDVQIVCRQCGSKTHVDEVPTAEEPLHDESADLDNGSLQVTENPWCDESADSISPPADVALAAAVAVLAPAFTPLGAHITMDRRQFTGQKYFDLKESPTEKVIAAHLQGRTIRGSGLCWDDWQTQSGRAARAIAWDSDNDLGRLIAGARKLRRAGLQPLLVKNPLDPTKGHLWLFFDEVIDPTDALARAEQIAPMLGKPEIPERFPNPELGGSRPGGRLRWPGGHYLPEQGPPAAVQVAPVPAVGEALWVAGDTAEGWAVIASAVSPAGALNVWVEPERRPKPPERPKPTRTAQAPTMRAQTGESLQDVVDRFNAAHPVEQQVNVSGRGMFTSPFDQTEWEPSAHYDARKGLWCDFSAVGNRRGGTALDLWCACNGFWPNGADKADRIGALRHLGLLVDTCSLTVVGSDCLVRLHIYDRSDWDRAKDALKAAFPARYRPDAQAWGIPREHLAAVKEWAASHVGAGHVNVVGEDSTQSANPITAWQEEQKRRHDEAGARIDAKKVRR